MGRCNTKTLASQSLPSSSHINFELLVLSCDSWMTKLSNGGDGGVSGLFGKWDNL